MIKRALLVTLLAVTSLAATSGASQAYPPGYNTNPITMVIHDVPKSYWDAVDRCTRDDSVGERVRCIRSLPYDPSTACLRVQVWYVDETFKTTHNNCGY